ncbi:hypothetical protein WJX72_012135 [[Myrmecia] bisecta]|uniref:amino-acid N-acetyltransferase n=1 Tax=[Myrmecia] bisecta TaxID=41462 RepID=A0AAW1PRI4_9CHLO
MLHQGRVLPSVAPFREGRAAACLSACNRQTLEHAASSSNGNGQATLAKKPETASQPNKFVQFFRSASPYIEGHRGKLFVLIVPGEVVEDKTALHPLLEDIALLHGLGVQLVVVLGARPQINEALREQGAEPRYELGSRVTDALAMQAAMQAAGAARMEVEARLSKGPAVQMVRRHTRTSDQFHYQPALQTVSGNYVAAKRRGVVDGVDFGFTGNVRFVQVDAVKRQLDAGNVVLLSNLGYSAAGEVLNCDIYSEAETFLDGLVVERGCFSANSTSSSDDGASSDGSRRDDHSELDFQQLQQCGLPSPLIAACTACQQGVKRAHLVDAQSDGSLLLELYSRDGAGTDFSTMISTDFYEGMRLAVPQDIAAIEALLKPLEDKGILLPRSRTQLLDDLHFFTVSERESKVFGCAMVKPLGEDTDGEVVVELAAFCIHPEFRGAGRGDSFLEYLEKEAIRQGMTRMVLLTTRTADWFQQRGFEAAGPAHTSPFLPAHRQAQVNPARNSQLYVKSLRAADHAEDDEPAKEGDSAKT